MSENEHEPKLPIWPTSDERLMSSEKRTPEETARLQAYMEELRHNPYKFIAGMVAPEQEYPEFLLHRYETPLPAAETPEYKGPTLKSMELPGGGVVLATDPMRVLGNHHASLTLRLSEVGLAMVKDASFGFPVKNTVEFRPSELTRRLSFSKAAQRWSRQPQLRVLDNFDPARAFAIIFSTHLKPAEYIHTHPRQTGKTTAMYRVLEVRLLTWAAYQYRRHKRLRGKYVHFHKGKKAKR